MKQTGAVSHSDRHETVAQATGAKRSGGRRAVSPPVLLPGHPRLAPLGEMAGRCRPALDGRGRQRPTSHVAAAQERRTPHVTRATRGWRSEAQRDSGGCGNRALR